MITVEKSKNNLKVIIPHGSMPPSRLNVFRNWLRLEEAAQQSQLSEQDADHLAEHAKLEWWTANRDKFVPPGEQ